MYYSIKAFEQCDAVDEIVIVSGADDIEYCRTEIVEKYGFKKVKAITAGGENAIILYIVGYVRWNRRHMYLFMMVPAQWCQNRLFCVI